MKSKTKLLWGFISICLILSFIITFIIIKLDIGTNSQVTLMSFSNNTINRKVIMIYFSRALTFVIFLMLGLSLGKRTFKHTNKFYEYTFIILIILSPIFLPYIGVDSHLIKIFDFEVIPSTALTAVFLGIVIRRYDRDLTFVQKFKNLI